MLPRNTGVFGNIQKLHYLDPSEFFFLQTRILGHPDITAPDPHTSGPTVIINKHNFFYTPHH
jgi:hypothetical protein